MSGIAQILCHRLRTTQMEIQMKMDMSRNTYKQKEKYLATAEMYFYVCNSDAIHIKLWKFVVLLASDATFIVN